MYKRNVRFVRLKMYERNVCFVRLKMYEIKVNPTCSNAIHRILTGPCDSFCTLEVMFLEPCKWLGTFLIKFPTKWLIAMENVRFVRLNLYAKMLGTFGQ